MAKYRKKPVVREAWQWQPGRIVPGVSYDGKWYVTTIHGQRTYLEPGDYVIKEPSGEGAGYYPCKPDIFEKEYDIIEENKPSIELK